MRIRTPEISIKDETLRLSARIETQRGDHRVPDELYFEFPAEHRSLIHPGIESFVVALYPYAMSLGEDIQLDGQLSPHLAYHIRTVQEVLCHLDPYLFRPVEICHGGWKTEIPERAQGVGVMFSGGVDAYHTLKSHLPSNQPVPGHAITHGVFVFRFDLPDSKLDSYREALAVYDLQFKKLGLTLVPAAFNVYDFRPPGTELYYYWLQRTHPIGLAALGMALSGGLGKLVLASSQTFDAYGDGFGGDFEIQTSLSTEWFQMIPAASVADRTLKTIAIAEWPETYDSLRVCLWDPNGVRNCGRCPKCLRTTTTLEVIGKLDLYTTFPKPYRPLRILRYLTGLRGGYYLGGIRRLAVRNGRLWIAFLLSIALWISALRAFVKSIIRIFRPGFKRSAG